MMACVCVCVGGGGGGLCLLCSLEHMDLSHFLCMLCACARGRVLGLKALPAPTENSNCHFHCAGMVHFVTCHQQFCVLGLA